MKHILESAEVMEQYAIIDMCYHAMQKISQDMSQRPKSGLELLIDHQTGYGEAKIKEWKETSIDLLKQIIKEEFLFLKSQTH